jgi:hypothetical protein
LQSDAGTAGHRGSSQRPNESGHCPIGTDWLWHRPAAELGRVKDAADGTRTVKCHLTFGGRYASVWPAIVAKGGPLHAPPIGEEIPT